MLYQTIIQEWATELAQQLGRSPAEIAEKGLSATDFSSSNEVEIKFPDGSYALFRYAFFVVNEQKGAVAVFTEHCGYHIFPKGDIQITCIVRKPYYG